MVSCFQMYAQRYGTVPVVHATGGLKDTVETFNPEAGTGTGWQFTDCSTDGLKVRRVIPTSRVPRLTVLPARMAATRGLCD